MSELSSLPDLPLMLAGVARPVTELLRETGLPTAPLRRMALSASGTGRFVLFDSRSTRSTLRARVARGQGLEPIDLAKYKPAFDMPKPSLWRSAPQRELLEQPAVARAFVEHLKLELEARGGLWVRMADFPFPFHTVPWQRLREDFSRWRQLRRKIELQAWRTDGGYEIHAAGDLQSFRPGIEIWRGKHLATLPLRGSVLNVRDDGLPFVLTAHQSPAGMAASHEKFHESTASTFIVPEEARVA